MRFPFFAPAVPKRTERVFSHNISTVACGRFEVRLCRTIRPYGQNERFLSPKLPKHHQRSIESAKNAEFSTFSTIKVRDTSLLFSKVVLLYKVRNFAERFAKNLTFFG